LPSVVVRLERISFAFRDSVPVLDEADARLEPGWAGLVGENGAGKSTLLRLLAGQLAPDRGRVAVDPPGASVVLCPQEVASPGDDVRALVDREDGAARRVAGLLRLDRLALPRWPSLSPGERKRWQIGAALARAPEVLLLDEPTNHLDAEGRALLLAALGEHRGVGVVVSHDRTLLEALTTRTLRLHRGVLASHAGPYGAARQVWETEVRSAWETRAAAQEASRAAERRLAEARRTREAAQRSRSGRNRDRKDHDARTLGATTLRDWAEARLAGDVRRLRTAAARAASEIPDVPRAVELGASVFLGFARAPRPVLASLDAPAVRAGDAVVLRDVVVRLGREDRVRLAGPNGAGKTTLLEALRAAAGLPEDRVVYLPQELPPGAGEALRRELSGLAPDVRGRVLSIVAALGCEPSRLLASGARSPGEARKLHLALGMGRHAWALLLDEPTNHLDLPSVERLEAALAAYPGALLLVTHDDGLAERCTRSTWRVGDGRVES